MFQGNILDQSLSEQLHGSMVTTKMFPSSIVSEHNNTFVVVATTQATQRRRGHRRIKSPRAFVHTCPKGSGPLSCHRATGRVASPLFAAATTTTKFHYCTVVAHAEKRQHGGRVEKSRAVGVVVTTVRIVTRASPVRYSPAKRARNGMLTGRMPQVSLARLLRTFRDARERHHILSA